MSKRLKSTLGMRGYAVTSMWPQSVGVGSFELVNIDALDLLQSS